MLSSLIACPSINVKKRRKTNEQPQHLLTQRTPGKLACYPSKLIIVFLRKVSLKYFTDLVKTSFIFGGTKKFSTLYNRLFNKSFNRTIIFFGGGNNNTKKWLD